LGTSYGLNVSTAALSLSHSLALSSAFLLPKIQLHYAIKSTDAAGNVEISPDQILNLPGIPVVILVRGVNGKPQAGATVTLDNDTATTNEKGSVTLSSGLGVMKVITTYQGVTVEKSITVGANTKPLTNYQLDLSSQPVDHWAATSLTLVAVIILLLGVDGALFGSRIVKRLLRLRTKPNAAQAALSDAEAPVVAAAVAVEPEQPDPALTDTIYDEEFVKDTAPAVTTAVTPDHTSDSEDTPPPQAEADDSRSTAPPVIVPPAEATPTYDVPPPPRADVMQIPVMEAEESQLVLKKAMPTKPRRKRAVAKKPRKRALPS
jgi:hypothetical protein